MLLYVKDVHTCCEQLGANDDWRRWRHILLPPHFIALAVFAHLAMLPQPIREALRALIHAGLLLRRRPAHDPQVKVLAGAHRLVDVGCQPEDSASTSVIVVRSSVAAYRPMP